MYYRCSENKGADQLRGYHEADLRLCFRICKKLVFSQRGSLERICTLSIEESRSELAFSVQHFNAEGKNIEHFSITMDELLDLPVFKSLLNMNNGPVV